VFVVDDKFIKKDVIGKFFPSGKHHYALKDITVCYRGTQSQFP